MSFSEASDSFLESRQAPTTSYGRIQYISRRTYADYVTYLRPLRIFFGKMRLEEITLAHFGDYERKRAAGDGFTRIVGNKKGGVPVPSPAGANKIRAELQVLTRIMRKAGCWPDVMRENYEPLQAVDSDIPRALSPDEQEHFLAVAGSNPEWHPLWWYPMVAVHLTFSSDEMRTIRIGDVNLQHKLISVNRRYGKNKYRRRTVDIYDAGCEWALDRLLDRARELGATGPHHFLFPFREAIGRYDPERPMGETGLRKQFDAVRKAARLDWFKLNGWRHTAITRLAERGVSVPIIMKRSGHMTLKMNEHYTHISDQVEREVMMRAYATMRKPVVSIDAPEAWQRTG